MTELITIIDLLAAKVAQLAFIVVVVKCISKRFKNKTANRFLMKIHRPAGYVLAASGLIHGVLSFRLFTTTPMIVYILGFICFFPF